MPQDSDLQPRSVPPDRRRWMAVLARASAAELECAWAAMPTQPAYELMRRPEIGLTLVRGRIGGTGDAFNLGEMTITRCAVLLAAGGAPGFAYVAGRDVRHAELAAVFDALMQSWLAREVTPLIESLDEAQHARRTAALAAAAATKVDFFALVRE